MSLLLDVHTPDGEAARKRLWTELRPYFATARELRACWNAEAETYLSRRTVDEPDEENQVYNKGVREAEAQIEAVSRAAEASHDLPLKREQLLVRHYEFCDVVARIRTHVAEYLGRVEAQLYFDERVSGIFDAHRAYVDARLQAIAPAAFEQLSAAYKRRAANNAEARAHALTSCRRALKSLADALYPATNETVVGTDGKERKMTDDMFVKRLMQFVGEKAQALGDAERSVLIAQIPYLGKKLDGLIKLASKGVHASTTDAEVDHCIIQTYLTIGDILRLNGA